MRNRTHPSGWDIVLRMARRRKKYSVVPLSHTSFYNFKKVAEAAVTFFEDKDVFRIITADRQAQLATKESRKRGRLKRLGNDEDQARREGFPYLAGGY